MTRLAIPDRGTPVSTYARWPHVVWDAALLRGLDARARGDLELAGRLRSVRKGELVVRDGEPADSLFVVVSGVIALTALRRGETADSVIRRAQAGETFGEEGTVVTFGTRRFDARCAESAVVAEVPLVVLRRALGRVGGGEQLARVERALRRAATLDLLRTTSFTRQLPDAALETLLDAASHREVARGAHVYRQGDDAEHAFFVADGLLQAQSDDDGKPRVEAYLARGDLFGDDELDDREGRRVSIVASGPAWVIAIPRGVFLGLARQYGAALTAAARVRAAVVPRPVRGGAQTTAHVFQDLYRMRVARSLLVIDQDSCVRCGHCAWSCASVHDDGISRLVRRGDKVLVQRPEEPQERELAPLLVPNSCQHCKNPSCMIDCPTGAIGRDARGEVFIREDLCTGCGSCAKACPWDNIQIAPRPASAKHGYPDVAVKCDLCSELAGGPACVASCPVEAIARIDPNAALVELHAAPRASAETRLAPVPAAPFLPRRTPAWPWVLGALLAGSGLFAVPLSNAASGWLAGALVVLLVAYAGTKRAPRLRSRIPALTSRALYIAHLALGMLAIAATLAHTHARAPGDLAGTLALAMLVALLSGAFGAVVQLVLPSRLARLERGSVLPEELAVRRREIDERIFAQLSGKNEVVKTLYGRVLRPYRAARLGPLWLALSGRRLKDEERVVTAHAEALLAGRRSERQAGLDDLVRLVVEYRATGALQLLTITLRGFLPIHLAATAASIVLLVVHVVAVLLPPMKERPRTKVARVVRSSDVTRMRVMAVAALGAAVGAGVALGASSPPSGTARPLGAPHASLACATCHDAPARASVSFTAAGACMTCHGKTEHASTRAAHRSLAQRGVLTCATCHPAHDGAQGITFGDAGAFTRWGAGASASAEGHLSASVKPGTKVPLAPLRACASCHDPASPRDPVSACVSARQRSSASFAEVPSLCFDEHKTALTAEARLAAWDVARQVATTTPWVSGNKTSGSPLAPLGGAFAGALALGASAALLERRKRGPAAPAAPLQPSAHKRLPVVNTSTCLGCYACVDVCPFDVLTIERYVAVVARPEECCGVVTCEQVCPNGSLTIRVGEPVADRPRVSEHLESLEVPGLFLAGDLTGLPLIKNAINQGVRAVDRIAASRPRAPSGSVDVLVIGAGPAGLSAALRAKEKGLSCVVLEQATVAASVKSFPRDKIVYDPPLDLPIEGELWMKEATKEELVAQWTRIVRSRGIDVREQRRVTDIAREHAGFVVTAGEGQETYRAARLVLAIGRRGTPRLIDLAIDPGAETHVSYALADARSFAGKRIIIAGLGDTAMEAAIAIASQPETSVTVSYRGATFARGKARNIDELKALVAKGKVRILFETIPVAVSRSTITLEGTKTHKNRRSLQADALLVLLGGVPSWDLLTRAGISRPPL